MRSRCMSLLPRTTLHSDSEQLYSTFFLVDVFIFQHFVRVYYLHSHVLLSLFAVLSLRHFLPFKIFPVDLLSHLMFSLSMFFIVGVFYFDILSVNQSFNLSLEPGFDFSQFLLDSTFQKILFSVSHYNIG
jgi:hypothetical protein